MKDKNFDIAIIGAGHAGVEAALAAARLGQRVALFTMSLDAVALMACNPSIGGTGKGHLVREIDALGGQMALCADNTCIQFRMLNTGKGPAVQSLRAQADKRRYSDYMKLRLEREPNIALFQQEVVDIGLEGGRISSVTTHLGLKLPCRALIVCAGVYLKGRVIIGDAAYSSGPSGLFPANRLSGRLADLGFGLRRFKTGTPPRVLASSIDFNKIEVQPGDEPIEPFSFLTDKIERKQPPCWLAYTNGNTHQLIRDNLHLAPLYTGGIVGRGPRYCPSIEDKIVRFADKERHGIFLEPEGEDTDEMYVQGLSTSLPYAVQAGMIRTITGFERAHITRPGYAIEYDCIDSSRLSHTLESKDIRGLYFAGQINGTSGYEEAAAQGLIAGINASMSLTEREPLVLARNEAYIGVMIDDLVLQGVDEPYRIMTSRAEYRLLLRQDDADRRLTEKSYRLGLASEERMRRAEERWERIETEAARLKAETLPRGEALEALMKRINEPLGDKAFTGADFIKRANGSYSLLNGIIPIGLPERDHKSVDAEIRYEGYIKRQLAQVAHMHAQEGRALPDDIDYNAVHGLRIEARQKLARIRPKTLGQASRLDGVNPADAAVLLIYLEKRARENNG